MSGTREEGNVAGSGLRVELLGGFRLTYDGRQLASVRTPRQQSLLACLILHRQHPQPRQRVAFLFWPDSEEAQALTNLRRELHHLRRALPDADEFLHVDDKMLQWRSETPHTLDVSQFEEALARIRPADQLAAEQELEEAIGLYQGDLLPDCYDEWVVPERERLRKQCLQALDNLAELLEVKRAHPEAIRYARRRLQLDPLYEAAYRRLMRLLALNGERAAALQLYHVCATTLRRDLGVDPDPTTQEAYRRLLDLETTEVPRSALAATSTLIGRGHEWQRLVTTWHRAARGEALMCVISGEAGIGKTRLAEELFSWCAAQHIPAARTRSYAAEGRLAYGPIAEWLRSAALKPGLLRLDTIWLNELTRLLPELVTERPGLTPASPSAEGWQRRHFFEALARGVLRTTPLLLLLDDLQWCDQDSLEWVHFLLRFDHTAKLLVVGTVRTEEQVDNRALSAMLLTLREAGRFEEIELGALNEADAAVLAQQVAERRLDTQAQAQIFRRTKGHPLFLVETIRSGLPIGADGDGALGPGGLPPKVQAIIAARLAQLSSAARELAFLAAAIGRDFRFELLREASDLEELELIRALDELWQRRLVWEQAVDTYDFSHDRIRDAAYAEIRPPRRRLLHRRIAQALEILHASDLDGVSAQLAAHYDRAGLQAKAVEFFGRAAKDATRLYASEEAIRHFTRALGLLQQCPESAQRDRQEISLQLALTTPLNTVSGYATRAMEAALDRVRVLGERLGDDEAVMRSLWGLCGLHFVRANIRKQVALAQEFHRRATTSGRFLADSLHQLAGGLASTGALGQARAYFEQAISHHDFSRPHPAAFGSDLGVFLLAFESHILWLIGYPDQARERSLRAISVADAFSLPYSQTLARAYAAILFQLSRDVDQSRMYADEVLALCRKYGFGYYAEWGTIIRAWACSRTTSGTDAVTEIDQALGRLRAMDAETRRPYYLSLLTHVYVNVGQPREAEAVLDAALATAAENHDLWWMAELYRLKGELAPTDSAEPMFRRALEVAISQGSKSLELRAAVSLARGWVKQGRRDEARALLAPIYEWFTEGLSTPDLRDAQALLAR